jgi:hypothetical protein
MPYMKYMNFQKNSKWKWKLILKFNFLSDLKDQIVQNLFDYKVQYVRCMVTDMMFGN